MNTMNEVLPEPELPQKPDGAAADQRYEGLPSLESTMDARSLDPTKESTLPSLEYRAEEEAAYIKDPKKANVEAWASKYQEEAIVAARSLGLDAAGNIGNPLWKSPNNRTAQQEAKVQLETAAAARRNADRAADTAGQLYDAFKKF